MRIIYECERLAVLEDNERFIVHILDNYRMGKEVIANRGNLISTIKKEFKEPKDKVRRSIFTRRKSKNIIHKRSEIDSIKEILEVRN